MQNWLEKHLWRHIRNIPLHPLQKASIVGLFVLISISLAQVVIPPSLTFKIDQMLSAVLPSVIVDLTNSERAAQHLNTLRRSALLDEAARLKAEHMRANNYFAHYSPDGVTPWHWFDVATYNYVYAGENLAVYFEDSADVVKAWMESPLHRDNILKKEYTEIGVAAVEGRYEGYSTVFVVQLFGTPAAQTQPTPVAATPITTKVADAETTTVTPPQKTVQGDTSVAEKGIEQETVPTEETVTPSTEEPLPSSCTVERVEIDGDTVYLSDHISTSTIPTMGATDAFAGESRQTFGEGRVDTQTLLQMLYILTLTLVLGFAISTALFAEKQRHHVQALYSVGLLVIATILALIQTQAVMAMTLL